MLRPDRSIACVYLHRAPVDMRRQIDGLAALVEGNMKQSALSGALFVFINKGHPRCCTGGISIDPHRPLGHMDARTLQAGDRCLRT